MGLHAIVFRNIHRLEEAHGLGRFELDELTGEAIPKPGGKSTIPRDAFFATRRRIGNLAEIGFLREATGKLLVSKSSLIMDRILCSGSHSGDLIRVAEFSRLKKEIGLLKSRNESELQTFIDTLESLLCAAESEHNPIVFA
jgi:hypothetical protein